MAPIETPTAGIAGARFRAASVPLIPRVVDAHLRQPETARLAAGTRPRLDALPEPSCLTDLRSPASRLGAAVTLLPRLRGPLQARPVPVQRFLLRQGPAETVVSLRPPSVQTRRTSSAGRSTP